MRTREENRIAELQQRIERGRRAIAEAQSEGQDVASWITHLHGLEQEAATLEAIVALRPHLPPPLQALSDDQVLPLVNYTIIYRWQQLLDKLGK